MINSNQKRFLFILVLVVIAGLWIFLPKPATQTQSEESASTSVRCYPEGLEGSPLSPELKKKIELWNELEKDLSQNPNNVIQKLEHFRTEYGLPINIFLSNQAPQSEQEKVLPNFDEDEGPDNDGVVFRKDFPSPKPNSSFYSGLIREVSTDKQTLNSWGGPSVTRPVAISGDEIYFDYSVERLCTEGKPAEHRPVPVWLSVKPDGSFHVVSVNEKAPPPSVKNFENNGCGENQECFLEFIDLKSGQKRILGSIDPNT